MKVRRLDKLPKRKVTVDDLLGLDTIKNIISDLDAGKSNIDELLVIYSERDGTAFTYMVNGQAPSRIVYMLECIKRDVLENKE